ncbi:hypothetical protein V6N11_000268 [Hibiscus sabdariffa]|uniref:WRKY domain-containing protein n=1 Tax=Hibiscus sabdariffa TaxID=183260 RepID=A0ABR2A1C3_9ROSI
MSNLYMENWDSYTENPAFSFDSWSFSEDFEPNPKVSDELEEFREPFYPELNPYSMPVLEDHVEEPENRRQQLSVSGFAFSGARKDSAKPKRSSRKNQKNRVVQHVTADGLQSDIWAWRKYGQKPIKGSPHPRSYYRCSSSKGCLARKQVERSCTDPGVFIITYTAEHSHGHPTKRNSLSGSTRNKSSTVTKSLAEINELLHEEEETAAAALVSPTNTDNESVKQEMEELRQMLEEVDDQRDKNLTHDIMLSEESVQSFEDFEFEGFFLDQFPDLSQEVWSMDESCNT